MIGQNILTEQEESSMLQIYERIEEFALQLNSSSGTHAVFMFGCVKAGLTTSSHFILHTIMRGVSKNGKVVYEIEHKQNNQKKIGQWYGENQTKAVNLFKINWSDVDFSIEDLYIIDCPGAMNEQWLIRYFQNPMYHYLIFRKFTCLKFVITFSYSDMDRSGKMMLDTFCEFFKMFKSINEIKSQLFKSVCILITNVPKQRQQHIKQQYRYTSTKITKIYEELYKQLKNEILENNRIFFVEAPPKINGQSDGLNKTLKCINKSTQFWVRDYTLSGHADMTHITDTLPQIGCYYTNVNDCSIQKMAYFYSTQVRARLGELQKAICLLEEDCRKGDQIQFYHFLVQKGKKIYERKQNNCTGYFNEKYWTQKRKDLMLKVFCNFQLFDYGSVDLQDFKLPQNLKFWLNKIQSFGRIEEIAKTFCTITQKQQYLDKIAKTLSVLLFLCKIIAREHKTNDMHYIEYLLYIIYMQTCITISWDQHSLSIISQQSGQKTFQVASYVMCQHQIDIKRAVEMSPKVTYSEIILQCVQQTKIPQKIWAQIILSLSQFKDTIDSVADEKQHLKQEVSSYIRLLNDLDNSIGNQ